jgi:transposase-like protein
MECPDRGKIGKGNIVSHSQKQRRCKCTTCGKTFSLTKGTAVYGLKKAHQVFTLVVTLLAFGCPVQAIVMAFGLDERTVRAWLLKAGGQCEQVHEQVSCVANGVSSKKAFHCFLIMFTKTALA